MSISEGKRKHLVALSDDRGVIAAAAMDQRGSLQKSIASAKGISPKEVTQEMMEEFKIAVSKILTPHASAILLDPEFGLPAAAARSTSTISIVVKKTITSAMHNLVERILLETPEGTQEAYVLATNVYMRTAQGWRMVAHHASPGTPQEIHARSDALPPILH